MKIAEGARNFFHIIFGTSLTIYKQEGNTLIDLHGFLKKIYYIIPILSRSGITYEYLINGHFPKIITRYQGTSV